MRGGRNTSINVKLSPGTHPSMMGHPLKDFPGHSSRGNKFSLFGAGYSIRRDPQAKKKRKKSTANFTNICR